MAKGTRAILKGYKRFQKALGPARAKAILRKHLRKATIRNGKLGEKLARQQISKHGYSFTPLAPLTKEIKGDDKPLTGANLFQAITSEAVDDTTVFVGVLRTEGVYNVAEAVHDGRQIKVTPAMRGMFHLLWQASVGGLDPSKLTGRAAELWKRKPGGWLPLRENTKVIVLPKRPFMDRVFANQEFIDQCERNWQAAMQAALAEMAGGGGSE